MSNTPEYSDSFQEIYDAVQLFSVMHWPRTEDIPIREAWVSGLVGHTISEAWPQGQDIPYDVGTLLRVAEYPEVLAVDIAERTVPGVMAGEILLFTLCLAVHAPYLASVNKAVKLVSRRNENRGWPKQRSQIMSNWSEFKPVAHLWAAYVYQDRDYLEFAPIFDPDEVAKFVLLAEQLRLDGERHFAHGQKKRAKPLLEPDLMFRILSRSEVVGVKIDYSRPTDDEMAILLGAD